MALYVVSYLRFVVISVTALGLTACARMNLPDQSRLGVEPRFGEPSASGQMLHANVAESEDQHLTALQSQIDALEAEIANLRSALALMGPLPPQDQFLIPVALSDPGHGDNPATAKVSAAELSQLYAPAPPLLTGRSVFFVAELGSYRSRGLAEADWSRLAAKAPLSGLAPRYSDAGSSVRLSVGPLASEAAVNALCVELAAVAGACRSLPPVRAFR